MDTALAPEAATQPTAQEPAVTPEPAKPLDVSEFVHKLYEQHGEAAAKESGTTETPVDTEVVKPTAEAAAPTPEPGPAPVEDVPFTTEQLSDPKHWDRLDRNGWARAEKLHPVETARVKAGYAAASRIAEAARNAVPRAEPEKLAAPAVDPYEEALAKTDSLDPKERAEGFRALARLEAESMFRAAGIDPIENNAAATERAAFRSAVQVMPELANLPAKELDEAVESDPELVDDVQLAVTLEGEARVRLLSKVMRRAGRIVLANRAATKATADKVVADKTAKDADAQKRLRSNQTNVSTTVVTTPSGKSPKGEETVEDSIRRKIAALPAA